MAVESAPLSNRSLRNIVQAFRHSLAGYLGDDKQQVERPNTLEEWARRFMPQAFRLPASDMHRWMCERFERLDNARGQFINLIGPRGNAKSSWAKAYILRCACEGTERLIYIVQDTADQARDQLEEIREQLEDNVYLGSAYPEACGRGRKWTRDRLDLPNGVSIRAYGTGQAIRGKKASSGERPTLIVADDLQNDNVITSGNRRASELRWFEDSLLKAGTKRTNVIVLGTALHRDCIVCELERRPGWQSRRFASILSWPALSLWEEWAAIYRDRDQYGEDATLAAERFFHDREAEMLDGFRVLWPEAESPYQLMEERERTGRVSFEREKQGNPITPETCYFPDEWFTGDDLWFSAWPDNIKGKGLTLDPSMGKTDRSDYSAFVWGAVSTDGYLYVDASIKRRTIAGTPREPGIVTEGLNLFRDWAPHFFGVETNQFQGALLQLFHQEAARTGLLCSVTPINNTEHKELRIRRLEQWLSGHRIRFKRGSAGAALLVDQLRQFPGGMHDDGPDALEMLVRLFLKMQRRV